MSAEQAWYFNLKTKQVERGKVSDSLQRMGPYQTKEEAEAALERAAQRNEEADAYDAEYEDDE